MLAFVRGYDVSVLPPRGMRIALKICVSMNLVMPAEIIAVAFVIVYVSSGNLAASMSYLLSTSSLSYRVKVLKIHI